MSRCNKTQTLQSNDQFNELRKLFDQFIKIETKCNSAQKVILLLDKSQTHKCGKVQKLLHNAINEFLNDKHNSSIDHINDEYKKIISLSGSSNGGSQASLTFLGGAQALCNTKNITSWSITNEGSFNVQNNVVLWDINVTKTTNNNAPTILKANGVMLIKNTGSGPADVGNIVINLQHRANNKWVSLSADMADVTHGDLYYSTYKSAYICSSASSEGLSLFTENAYSGPLSFYDQNSNTIFSIVGGFVIQPNQTVELIYQAQFFLPSSITDGPQLRIETIVTFGNAGSRGGSGAVCNQINYKGNNILYDNIRSIPFRTSLDLPPVEDCNQTVTLRSISTDVSVTEGSFTNYLTDIGSSGSEILTESVTRFVSVVPDPITHINDRVFTDCAYLKSPNETIIVSVTNPETLQTENVEFICCEGVDLSACDDVTVPGQTIQPPPLAYVTYTQGGWGSDPHGNNPGTILTNNFSTVYPSGVTIGKLPSFNAKFTSAAAINSFLPQGGPPNKLTANLVNPITSSAGVFGGQMLALSLNVGFSISAITSFNNPFHNLILCDDNNTLNAFLGFDCSSLVGKTILQILTLANIAIGGGISTLTMSNWNTLVTKLNEAFDNGVATSFANNYLCTA